MKKSIYNILRGTFLVSDDSFKNWRVILFISGLAIVMIASSHNADKKVYEIARLKNEVKEIRSQFVDGRSRLMRLKMESHVVSVMNEKGLSSSETPPQKIKVLTKEKD
ncbi:FtsL-like putative cell division protein [Tamlana sp. 2_MG-2023]|uniref:FtsL-like putative cell division protein n=1 Tax=unclassified Tamlana TaxID=2614803 RepID=UPI0026E3D583|nr:MULTISPECIES: FtsL-like putative cell division protein [unclassified Tamlana]MDO6761603.1 FtsL-like putative cell division protein [Tamlana sp. 2_MG-2023]MDO6792425.1 FtsL-like putative cell division protein [Tamlana sp. 1_MG-2023]